MNAACSTQDTLTEGLTEFLPKLVKLANTIPNQKISKGLAQIGEQIKPLITQEIF